MMTTERERRAFYAVSHCGLVRKGTVRWRINDTWHPAGCREPVYSHGHALKLDARGSWIVFHAGCCPAHRG